MRVQVSDRAGRRATRLRVPAEAVRHIARGALAAEGVTSGELSVVVVRDPEIRELNAKFRGTDEPTNVLAFPQPGAMRGPGRSPVEREARGRLIGDVVISVDFVDRQGKETGAGFRYTFAYYLVHGVLHLLGYDHHQPAMAKKMYRRTDAILADLGET